jgi:signal transduction histidine kinase
MVARPVAVRRSVSNLIENALHYGGNVRVAVRDRGDLIEIEVADDGPGIPDDQLEEVLPAVRAARQCPFARYAGMGLGLPIVHRAIRSENGRLHLRNAPQGGLRATIRLPRVPD